MVNTKTSDEYYEAADQISQKTVTIEPGGGKAVGLGIYKASTAGPDVQISYNPDVRDDIGVSHERLDIPNQESYILLYQFQNFSQTSCQITMRLAGSHHID